MHEQAFPAMKGANATGVPDVQKSAEQRSLTRPSFIAGERSESLRGCLEEVRPAATVRSRGDGAVEPRPLADAAAAVRTAAAVLPLFSDSTVTPAEANPVGEGARMG